MVLIYIDENSFRKENTLSKLKKVLIIIGIIILVGIISVAGYVTYCISTSDKINPKNIYEEIEQSSTIYDENNNVIGTVSGSIDRKILKPEEIPDVTKNAFIAIEDKTFYKHHGINAKRMIGAVFYAIVGNDSISGTSTITQQLARNVYLRDTMTERSIKRKIVEIWYAFEIEKSLSKDEIITAYLNTIYLGYGNYGIDSAAESYFSKNAKNLNLAESAALAALPQAPDSYALIQNEKNDSNVRIRDGIYANKISEDRRDIVLDFMVEQGYATKDDAEKAKIPIEKIIKPKKYKSDSTYTYFNDYLINQVKKDLISEYSISEEEAEVMIYNRGLKIYSTVDPKAQEVAYKELNSNYGIPATSNGSKTQAAMVIVENGTGKIKAMIGGRKTSGQKLYNRAISPRQPGSTIKPLSVYGAALQKSFDYAKDGKNFSYTYTGYDKQGTTMWGNYITAGSPVLDEKMYVNGKSWPYNASGYYSGYRTFRTALQQSINTCAVKIQLQVGNSYSAEMLKKFGISTVETDVSKSANDMNAAALALGGMTHGISPLESALAYATFANNGIRNSAVCYTKVVDANGETILTGKSKTTKVMDAGVSWIMSDVLQSVVNRGIAGNARISGVPVGGKTGTTNAEKDLWFAGFTPSYSASLWMGADQATEMYGTSANAAAMWSRIMRQIPNACKGSLPSKPSNVIYYGGEYYTRGTEQFHQATATKKTSKNDNRISYDVDPGDEGTSEWGEALAGYR